MNFAEAIREESTHVYTENGAEALSTTGSFCLDLFSCVGGLRDSSKEVIELLVDAAYAENPSLVLKILFYARDIRCGLGERAIFKTMLHWMAVNHPDEVRRNIKYVSEYGRWDDLYCLINTPVESYMWSYMSAQLSRDIEALNQGKEVSLLAKWVKTADASSKNTRELGILTAIKLGYPVPEFKRVIKRLRNHLNLVEIKMSGNEWEDIDYSVLPSRALYMYRNAFSRHTPDKFSDFVQRAANGEVQINFGTLYPYDLVLPFLLGKGHLSSSEQELLLDAQWNQLPNYVEEGQNILVMADTSASMEQCGNRPLASAIGLAIYFAERNKGAFHNIFMTFSSRPSICVIKGSTLKSKVNLVRNADWGGSTNFEAALQKVLNIAVKNKVSAEDMVKALVVVSDMEFNGAIGYYETTQWGFFSKMEEMYEARGYKIPNIVFWNVNSRHNLVHSDMNHKGVQLVSGNAASSFKNLTKCISMTPYEMMIDTLSSERYSLIK